MTTRRLLAYAPSGVFNNPAPLRSFRRLANILRRLEDESNRRFDLIPSWDSRYRSARWAWAMIADAKALADYNVAHYPFDEGCRAWATRHWVAQQLRAAHAEIQTLRRLTRGE